MKPAKTKPTPIEEFLALTDSEKERIWESYNREIPDSETRPLTSAEQDELDSARRAARSNRRRSMKAKSARRVQISLEGHLLKRADAYAARHRMTRAELIAKGLKLAMAS